MFLTGVAMSYQFYKMLHIVGVVLAVAGLIGLCSHAANGGEKRTHRWRVPLSASHGLGLLILLVSGFGMLARLGLSSSLPWWVMLKLLVWGALGGVIALIYKGKAGRVAIASVVLTAAAAWLGLFHG
jgi:hypothetical protein